MLRLADLEKLVRQRAEMTGDAAKGKLVFWATLRAR